MSTTSIIVFVAAAVLFAWLWRKGHLLRFTNYVQATQVELKKCTWPTQAELRGSTVVVLVSTALLGIFTVAVDFVLSLALKFLRA
jgi:preprotein translocase subunit SecE